MNSESGNEEVKEDFKKIVARSIADRNPATILERIAEGTIMSVHPKQIIDKTTGLVVVSLYHNVKGMRGLYSAYLNGDELQIFETGVKEPMATFNDPMIRVIYDDIVSTFGQD